MPTPSQQPPQIDYRFTPSQLDAYQDLLDAEYLWGQFWGSSEEPAKSALVFGIFEGICRYADIILYRTGQCADSCA